MFTLAIQGSQDIILNNITSFSKVFVNEDCYWFFIVTFSNYLDISGLPELMKEESCNKMTN
jgi:hypothetical protein